tara:strand:+ start:303 stop:506 length:204 start_codon:yes stop_codon:yes gene_type:complete
MQSISELATSEHDADDMAEQENEGFIKGKPPNQLYTCFAKFVKNSREHVNLKRKSKSTFWCSFAIQQ